MRFRPWIVLIAILVLLTVYYAVHKPFDVTLIQSWIGFMLDLLPVGFLAIGGGSIGRWLLTHFGLRLESRAERVAIEALLGLGIISEATLIIGLLGGFRTTILWPLWLLIGLVMLILTRAGWLQDMASLVRRAFHPEVGWSRWFALFVWLMLALGLLMALLPPTAWDALTYHLAGPMRYLSEGRIAAQDNSYLGFPQNTEMLYGLAMSLFGRDTAAAPIHWFFGALALLGTMGLIRRTAGTYGERSAWLTAALLLSSYSVWLLLGWAYVDLAVMAYSAVIPIALNHWQRLDRPQWLALAGTLIGLALGVKLTSVALLGAAVVYVLITHVAAKNSSTQPKEADRRRHWLRSGLRHAVILGLFAFVAFMPWMIKGAILYHNPIYPYLFGGNNWDAARAIRFSQLNDSGNGLLGSARAWQWPLLPITATVFGSQSVTGFDFTTGPWLMVLPLLLIFAWRSLRVETGERQLAQSSLAFIAPLLFAWWIVASFTNIGIQTRFMTMALPTTALLGALAVQGVRRWPIKPFNIYFMLHMIFALTFAFAALDAVRLFVQFQGVSYFTGFAGRNDVLAVAPPDYTEAMNRLAELPTDSKVRWLWESRGYYCPAVIKCTPDYFLDAWQEALDSGNRPDQVFALWKSRGDQYILVYDTALSYYQNSARTADVTASFSDTLPNWTRLLWKNNGYTLYRWTDPIATF